MHGILWNSKIYCIFSGNNCQSLALNAIKRKNSNNKTELPESKIAFTENNNNTNNNWQEEQWPTKSKWPTQMSKNNFMVNGNGVKLAAVASSGGGGRGSGG